MNHAAFVEHFFAYGHLPTHLQAVSAPFAVLARNLVAAHTERAEAFASADARETPGRLAGAEIAVALRKLREAKDCAVLAAVALHKVTP